MKIFQGPGIFFLLLFFLPAQTHGQQRRIYIANDDHTDYLWSADERTYRDVFVNMLDYYIGKADSTIRSGFPPELQSRFNCDGNFWIWTYEQNRSPAEVAKLVEKIRSGHISVPFNALVSCHGGSPSEGVLRGMYYAGSLERRFNLDLDLAVAMENQTHPLGLASIWAGAGAKYSWKGVCGCTSEFKDGQLANRGQEVYWYKGLDGRRILMKWYSLNDGVPPGRRDKNESLGGYAEARDPFYAVNACKKKFNDVNYSAYTVAGAFGYGWDDLETYNADIFINAAKAGTDDLYKVVVSNEQDFFEDLEATHGRALPSQSVTHGNEWDVLCASLAETSAKIKRSLLKLRVAEAMAAVVAPYRASFGSALDSARIKAWMAYGLYWEHDWTTDNLKVISSPQRAAWQRKMEGQATGYATQLYALAAAELGRVIGRSGSRERFFVFNPLGWERSDYADYPYQDNGNIVIRDLSERREVPHQAIMKDGIPHVRILATDIPSVGYKVFEILARKGKVFQEGVVLSSDMTVMENKIFKVTINRTGAITSLVDKRNGNRECIGGGRANDLGSLADSGVIEVENKGPVSVTVRAVSSDPLSHTTRITLYSDLPRVDIDNSITQNFRDVRKWKFDFRLTTPETWHEEVGAVIQARLTTNGGHYSTANASYKYQTLNHFASVNEANYGITLSNRDCYFMQLGNSSFATLDESSSVLNVLAGGRAILPDRGIADQDGDSIFHQSFALSTHTDYSEAGELKLALAHQTPLVTGAVTGESAYYPDTRYSYVEILDPDVVLWALKPAEEGYADRGVVVRVWNTGKELSNEDIVFRRNIAEAHEVSHVETDIRVNAYSGATLEAVIPVKGMNTYRVKFRSEVK